MKVGLSDPRRRCLVLVAALVAFALINIRVEAGTIYVSTTGNDSNNGGLNDPVFSVARAFDLAASFDTIEVAAGSYLLSAQVFAASAKTVTITGTGSASETSLVANETAVTAATAAFLRYASFSSNNVTFQSLTISSGLSPVVWAPNGEVTFVDCIVQSRASYSLKAEYSRVAIVRSLFTGAIAVAYANPDAQFVSSVFENTTTTSGDGGAILIDSSPSLITFQDCIFRNNTATAGGGGAVAIRASSATMTNCRFYDNKVTLGVAGGGGIYLFNSGATKSYANCTNCIFERNRAGNGGAVRAASSDFRCLDCVFLNNSATSRGGAVNGLSFDSLVLENCAFVGNTLLSGGSYAGAVYTENGNGILRISYCIFDGNKATTSINGGVVAIVQINTAIVEHSVFKNHNVIGNGGCIFMQSLTGNPTFTVTNSSFVNNLASLAGAVYLSGISSSVSLGTVRFTNCLFDSNGAVAASSAFGGAVVYGGFFLATFENCVFSSNLVYSSSTGSSYGGAVALAPSLPAGTVVRTVQFQNCSFESNSAYVYSPSTNSLGGAIYVTSAVELSIYNCSFQSNGPAMYGAAMFVYPPVTSGLSIVSSSFVNNFARNVGTVYVQNAGVTAVLINSTSFDGNIAPNGGAFANFASAAITNSFANCRFSRNSVTYAGGAIWISSSSSGLSMTKIFNSTLASNKATTYGGAIGAGQGANITVSQSTFTSNMVNVSVGVGYLPSGGAIGMPKWTSSWHTLSVFDSTFDGNSVGAPPGFGGAIQCSSAEVKIYRSRFTNNRSTKMGSALGIQESDLLVEDSTFQSNSARCTGGAIYAVNAGAYNAVIRRSVFDSNFVLFDADNIGVEANCTTVDGGALFIQAPTTNLLENLTFTNNSAQRHGRQYLSGISEVSGGAASILGVGYLMQVTVSSVSMDSNTAIGRNASGGGLYLYSTDAVVENSNFTRNSVTFQGGGLFYSSLLPNTGISLRGNRFESNRGCVGVGALLLEDDTQRATISENSFTFNEAKVTPESMDCSFSQGAGLAIWGSITSVNVTKCAFANNRIIDVGPKRPPGAFIRAEGAGLVVNLETVVANNPTMYFEDNSFVGNLITTNDDGFGAMTVTGNNLKAVLDRCTFKDNAVRNWAGIELGGRGAALFAGSKLATGDGFQVLTVRNSYFENNTAETGGAMLIRNSNSYFMNNTWIRNSGYTIAGAGFFVTTNQNTKPWTTFLLSNNRFISNRAGYTSFDGCCYSSISAQGPRHHFYFDASTRFEDNEFDPLFGFSTDLGCVVGATCTPIPTGAQGQAVDISGYLLAEGATLDLTQVTASMRTLKVWDKAYIAETSYVLIGDYNVTADNSSVFNFATVKTSGTGSLNLYGKIEILGGHVTTLSGSLVNNYGNMKNYESRVEFESSTLRNMPSGQLTFENFNPEVNWTGTASPAALVKSQFVNEGEFALSTGNFANITMDFSSASSRLKFMVTNYWQPATLKLDPLVDLRRGGAFVMDGTPLRKYSEPKPFQEFVAFSAETASSFTQGEDFASFLSLGGYHYRLTNSTNSAVDPLNITLTVIGFYPISVRVANEATFIRVTFPRPTNVAGGLSGYDCASILHTSFLNTLSSPKCLWKSSTELHIRSDVLSLSQDLQFVDASITDTAVSDFYVWGNTTHAIDLPATLPVPRAVLVTASTVQPCADIKVDGSASVGTGAFAVTYTWELVGINGATPSGVGSASTLSSFIAAKTSSVLVVPASLLDASWTSLSVKMTITSPSFGTLDQQTVLITRNSASLIELSIEGPQNRVAPTSVDYQIKARVEVPSCSPLSDSGRIVSSWTVVSAAQPANFQQRLFGLNTTTLYIPSRSMAPDTKYTFKYTASVFADATLSTLLGSYSIDVNVTAIGSPMYISSVGDGGLVSTLQNINLQVRLDDPDESSLAASGEAPLFAWVVLECPARGQLNTKATSDAEITFGLRKIAAGSYDELVSSNRTLADLLMRTEGAVCSYPNSTTFVLPTPNTAFGPAATMMSIPSGLLAPGEYTLLAIAARGSRSALTLIKMNATADVDGSFYWKVRVDADLHGADKHLPQNRLLLRGFVNGDNAVPTGQMVRWSLVGEQLNTTSVQTSLDNINLVLAPDSLLPGRAYTFQLDAFALEAGNSTTLRGSNTLTVIINSSPQGGGLIASPTQGGMQGNLFSISLPGWVDDDPPVRYLVFAYTASRGNVLLSDMLELPSLSAIMPIAGDPELNNTLELRAYISDTFDSSTFVSATVQVLPNPEYSSDLVPTATTDSLVHDLRFFTVMGAMQQTLSDIAALDPITPTSNVALLCEMAASIDMFAHSVQLTPANTHALLKSLELLTSPSPIPACVLDVTLRTLETAVSGTAASAPTLIASQNSASRATAIEVIKAVSNVVKSVSQSTPPVDEATRIRLVQLLIDLARLQGMFSVVDEVPTVLTGNDIFLLTANISASALQRANISIGNITILLNIVDGSTVDVNLVRWINSTFPLTNSTSGTGVQVGKTVITVISSSPDGIVTVIFNGEDAEGPSGLSSSSLPSTCGVFDSTKGAFDSTGCTLTPLVTGGYTCSCPRTGSLGLLFDFGTDPAPGDLSPATAASAPFPLALAVGLGAGLFALIVIIAITIIIVFKVRHAQMEKSERKKLQRLQVKMGTVRATNQM